MTEQNEYITRKLSWIDERGEQQFVEDSQLLKFNQPLIILGEPGMGKTRLMEELGKQEECQFIRATSFLRKPDSTNYGDKILVIDGLDEIAALEEGDPLHNILKKMVAFGNPRFIISCRSAEWQSVMGRLDVKDEYGQVPLEMVLQPLTEEDALRTLEQRLGLNKAKETIYSLNQAGLNDLYKNPLTLDFVAAIAATEGTIETKSTLFELAVSQLRLEPNQRHNNSRLSQLSKDHALDAAGAAMAILLITGCDGITTKSNNHGALSLSELSDFGDLDAIRAVLGSNLFRLDTMRTNHFLPLHRTVAEYLGARWLATTIERNEYPSRTAKRLLGIISAEGGVPASLRGLHAWLPKFSPECLGPKAIDRDPYGILRYGDGDNLSVKQAEQIISSLRQLAAFDPNFRSDWSDSISLKGLALPQFIDELRAIITDENEPFQLRSLVLEAINRSHVAKALQVDLETILFDNSRTFSERSDAGEAIINIENSEFDWSNALEQLIELGDEDSTRLAVGLLDDIGFDELSTKLIARVIISEAGILKSERKENRHNIIGTFYSLGRKLPVDHIKSVLDELTAIVLPVRDPEKWWGDGYYVGQSEFTQFTYELILRQLENDETIVSPQQLWNWMRALRFADYSSRDDQKAVEKIIQDNTRLRRGVQRLALFEPGTEEKFFHRLHYMEELSFGFALTDDDARVYLAEVVERNNPAERMRWMGFVSYFRSGGLFPKAIQTIARPYAHGDQELIDFLTKKPKLEEWEIEHRRKLREREQQKDKTKAEARKEFKSHIDEIKSGELRWIFNPARGYLNMFRDLEGDASPSERLIEWMGESLCEAALQGFEAVLHRDDLPTAKQIAESYAESRHWNFVFPMLAGAGQRMLDGRGFNDLTNDLLSALAIAAENELSGGREQFGGLKDALVAQLRSNPDAYEAHIRQQFEPMFKTGHTQITGLYQFTRQDLDRPLSTKLCLEWLQNFSDLALEVERELVRCIVYTPDHELDAIIPSLINITMKRLENQEPSSDREIFWRSLHFHFDFDNAVHLLPSITENKRNWLWPLTKVRDSERGRLAMLSIEQLKWIVSNFRLVWPSTDHPSGVTSGDTNLWDATRLLKSAIYQIANDPSDEAVDALLELRNEPEDGYSVTVQAAIAAQHRVKLESRFKSPSLADIKAVLNDAPPSSVADIQAIVLDELADLQQRIRGDELDLVNTFYTDAGKPRTENECTNRLLISLGKLPFGIQAPPENAMPQRRRSDAAFVYGDKLVPLEAKGQWHKEVWSAAETQLDRYYSTHHKAAEKGIYLVYWFGLAGPAGKRLKSPPSNLPRPSSAEEMELALQNSLPLHRRSDIAVIVLDLTRP